MRYQQFMTIGLLSLAAVSCRKKSAFDEVGTSDLSSESNTDLVVSGDQPVSGNPDITIATDSNDSGSATNADDDIPKVSCNRSSVDEFGGHIGTCTEYFVGPEESLQVDKATELEAACVEEGGVWDVQACKIEDNLIGTCKTPGSGNEPSINELVYGSNTPPVTGDVKDDSQTNCAKPSVWVENI